LRWVIYTSADSISAMWMLFGSWLIATIMSPVKKQTS
jgi:hypothetical protein